jgi:hypothetical protein
MAEHPALAVIARAVHDRLKMDIPITSAIGFTAEGFRDEARCGRDQVMTVTLHLKPELEAGLVAQARAAGKTLEEYVLSMVEVAVMPTDGSPMSPEQRASAFKAWSVGHRPTPLLSDYAVSREGIYEGRDAE